MSQHAVRATVAVAALSLALLGPPIQAQDTPSTQELADLRARAEAGDASAQYNLGLMHAEGRGVPKDAAAAVIWYRKAAEQGDAGAQYHLGLMYAEGRGVPQDAAAASAWFRTIDAEQINFLAQHKLGRMYAGGLGVAQDFTEAAVWFRRGAEKGDAVAQYDLGNMYAEGRGVSQDFAEAATWYRKAAELTNVPWPEKGETETKVVTAEIVSVDEKTARYGLFVEEFGHVRTGYGTTSIIKTFEDVEAWLEKPHGVDAV